MANLPPYMKTPASALEELANMNDLRTSFDLVLASGQVHEPTFKFRAAVGDFEAFGIASNKKLAKQISARNCLLEIQKKPGTFLDQERILKQTDFSSYNTGSGVQTPKEATQVEINVVGKLSEYCAKWKIPAPHFKDEKEELLTGNQHEFTTSCTLFNVSEECRKLTVEGKGLKKTLSKREAALNMLTKLREMEIDINAVPVKEEPKAQDEAPANENSSDGIVIGSEFPPEQD